MSQAQVSSTASVSKYILCLRTSDRRVEVVVAGTVGLRHFESLSLVVCQSKILKCSVQRFHVHSFVMTLWCFCLSKPLEFRPK